MKYISEDELLKYKNNTAWCQRTLQELLSECKELDELTVTKLRPMSECGGFDVLIKFREKERFNQAFCDLGLCYIGDDIVKYDECEGWIPLPTYRPGE